VFKKEGGRFPSGAEEAMAVPVKGRDCTGASETYRSHRNSVWWKPVSASRQNRELCAWPGLEEGEGLSMGKSWGGINLEGRGLMTLQPCQLLPGAISCDDLVHLSGIARTLNLLSTSSSCGIDLNLGDSLLPSLTATL
jgi:hypothetical protein